MQISVLTKFCMLSDHNLLTFWVPCTLKCRRKILMLRQFYATLQVAFSIAFLLFAAGCGEDPRYAARTQYLGGAYGSAPAGPPRDTVTYWDGDGIEGKPSITISLTEQSAYYYKRAVLVGVSVLAAGSGGIHSP